MKIYSESKFIYNGNVVVCRMKSLVYLTVIHLKVPAREPFAFYTKGIARCSPEDKYNPKIGEALAESRATLKMYKKISVFLEQTKKDIQKLIHEANLDTTRYNELVAKEEAHLTDLLNNPAELIKAWLKTRKKNR